MSKKARGRCLGCGKKVEFNWGKHESYAEFMDRFNRATCDKCGEHFEYLGVK